MAHLQLLPDTQLIIRELEKQSGYPVTYFEDPTISVFATIRTGTRSNPVHVIRYRPNDQLRDYRIAFEVGFALRMFARPPAKRFHLTAQPGYRDRLVDDVKRLNPNLDEDAATKLGHQLFDGLLLQVRSCPTGMLVDLWIRANHHGLRKLQDDALRNEARENTACLEKTFDDKFPQVVVRANRSMNAAHAVFVADLLGQPDLSTPYRLVGLEGVATKLLEEVTRVDVEHVDDQELIEIWARHLDIAAWLKWLPFDSY